MSDEPPRPSDPEPHVVFVLIPGTFAADSGFNLHLGPLW
jgi:hypothetical protein